MRLCGHGPSVRLHVTLELAKDAARVEASSIETKTKTAAAHLSLGQTPQVNGDGGEEEDEGDAQVLHAPAQCTLAVEHLTQARVLHCILAALNLRSWSGYQEVYYALT